MYKLYIYKSQYLLSIRFTSRLFQVGLQVSHPPQTQLIHQVTVLNSNARMWYIDTLENAGPPWNSPLKVWPDVTNGMSMMCFLTVGIPSRQLRMFKVPFYCLVRYVSWGYMEIVNVVS